MKKILVLTPLDKDNMLKYSNYLIEELKPYPQIEVLCPVYAAMMASAALNKPFYIGLLAVLKNITSLKNNSSIIVVGNASKNIEFDEILLIDWNTLSTQEAYLNINYSDIIDDSLPLYKSKDAAKIFKNKEELLNYIKEKVKNAIQ